MTVYLDNKPLPEAQRIWKKACAGLGGLGREELRTIEALHRVTAQPIYARRSSPHYPASAMDGFAVAAADTYGASVTRPVRLKIDEQTFRVDTGDPIPESCNAVIMIEDVDLIEADRQIEITAAAAPWQHVRPIGEDVVQSELLLPRFTRLTPAHIGALIAGGAVKVPVLKKPRVALIPTGTEIVESEAEALKPGDIVEYNTRVIAGLVEEWGGTPDRRPIVPDDRQLIKDVLAQAAAECDVVVINAGSSAGREDFTAEILEELGQVLVHGVAIKPAKPTILGLIGSVPVIGVPGYPVSANLAVRLFLEPLLYWLQGQTPPEPAAVPARLTRRLVSPLGAEEFVRVKVARVGREIVATPLSRGAGIIMSVVRSDGFVRIPAQSEGLPEDSEVTVWLDSPDTNLNRTIMAIGSHDVALDILADLLKARYPEWALSSAHVGSQGGLLALKRGEAHLAGIHLLDPATGDYNKGYLKQYLPGRDIVLLNLIYRVQGLMVRQGNPKGIKDLRDLARNDVVFVNRQRGAGTRVLLDYELQRLNLTPAQITGYSHEEYTHLGVAASVAGGTADVGLGIATAARSFGLDFIPVTAERYDLAIPREYYNSPMIQALVEVIRSQQFEAAVTALGGYDTRLTGQEM